MKKAWCDTKVLQDFKTANVFWNIQMSFLFFSFVNCSSCSFHLYDPMSTFEVVTFQKLSHNVYLGMWHEAFHLLHFRTSVPCSGSSGLRVCHMLVLEASKFMWLKNWSEKAQLIQMTAFVIAVPGVGIIRLSFPLWHDLQWAPSLYLSKGLCTNTVGNSGSGSVPCFKHKLVRVKWSLSCGIDSEGSLMIKLLFFVSW